MQHCTGHAEFFCCICFKFCHCLMLAEYNYLSSQFRLEVTQLFSYFNFFRLQEAFYIMQGILTQFVYPPQKKKSGGGGGVNGCHFRVLSAENEIASCTLCTYFSSQLFNFNVVQLPVTASLRFSVFFFSILFVCVLLLLCVFYTVIC